MKNLTTLLAITTLSLLTATETVHADQPNVNKILAEAAQVDQAAFAVRAKANVLVPQVIIEKQEINKLNLEIATVLKLNKQIKVAAVNGASESQLKQLANQLEDAVDAVGRCVDKLKDQFGSSATKSLRDSMDDLEDAADDLADEID